MLRNNAPSGNEAGALIGAGFHERKQAHDRSAPRPPISASWRKTGGIRKGSSAMLHRLNPARLRLYPRRAIDAHWGCDPAAAPSRSQAGRALDVGCGAGLLAEPLARLGRDADRTGCRAREYRRRAASCRGQGLGARLSRGRRGDAGAGGALRPRRLDGGGGACRRTRRLRARPGRRARAGRADAALRRPTARRSPAWR